VPPKTDATNVLLIQPKGEGFWGRQNGEAEQLLVSQVDRQSPVLQFLDLYSLQLRKMSRYQMSPGATAYVETFDGPLLFGNWEREPRWLVMAANLENSDLVLRTAFPILLGNLVQSVRPIENGTDTQVPGSLATYLKPILAPEVGPEVRQPDGGFSLLAWLRMQPLWCWALIAGAIWLLVEWLTYTKRITE
jgi:hypothetical protein